MTQGTLNNTTIWWSNQKLSKTETVLHLIARIESSIYGRRRYLPVLSAALENVYNESNGCLVD